jgi:hypothetical protein
MSVNDQSAASRQFVATCPAYSPKWIKGTRIWGLAYSAAFVVIVLFVLLWFFGPMWGVHLQFPHIGAAVGYGVLAGSLVVGVGVGAYWFWHSRRKYLITVTSGGLNIDRRRDDVYSLLDAQLGLWVDMGGVGGGGVALHLQCGRHRFLLGGRDRRVGPATPLDAPPVQLIDAWLWASDFDELLTLGGRSAARGPAPGEPTRCALWSFASLKNHSGNRNLFIDVDTDAIRVIDPDSNALNASALLSQVTATPAIYRSAGSEFVSTMPAMAVCVPGMQPLTIGCRDYGGPFSWRDNVPAANDPPAYTVSGADWLTLAEKFGLAAYLEDTAK